MSRSDASDLHITVGSPPVAPRARRISSALEGVEPLDGEATQTLLYRMLSTEQQKQLEIDKPDRPRVRRARRSRASASTSTSSARRSARPSVRSRTDIKSLEELGLPASLLELATKPRGLVLVTGPTGSGKSTTLAALIDEINRTRSDHILTIEDPIEFVHRHKRCIVNQREIGVDATELRRGAARRAPPGPRRDPPRRDARPRDDLDRADRRRDRPPRLRARCTRRARRRTIDRIIDVFPAEQQEQVRTQLASTLQGVVTQTLLPTADGTRPCRRARGALPRRRRAQPDPPGRRSSRSTRSCRPAATRGMQTLEQSLADLVLRRVITQDVAMGAHQPARAAARAARSASASARSEDAEPLVAVAVARNERDESRVWKKEISPPKRKPKAEKHAEAREAG